MCLSKITTRQAITEDDVERIPDPTEIMNSRLERLADEYIDDNTCMSCGKKVEYELYHMSPTGDGPSYCYECAGCPEL